VCGVSARDAICFMRSRQANDSKDSRARRMIAQYAVKEIADATNGSETLAGQ